MSIRYLWLDDERDPKDPAIQKAFGATGEEMWVKDVYLFKQVVKTGIVETVSLDHDLGDNQPTGYEAACLIERLAMEYTIPRLRWRVHSSNPVGRMRMEQALRNADKYWTTHEAGVELDSKPAGPLP